MDASEVNDHVEIDIPVVWIVRFPSPYTATVLLPEDMILMLAEQIKDSRL